ncbi:MAG: hypothetical protein HGA96_17965 [Desulfobulbaceae bacterium]|nr:hypothetical protein [Desulfobulbaceae bacterium]
MKKVLILLFFLLLPHLSQAKTLTKEELLKIGAKQVDCTITYVGSYNFLATDSDGKEINFITDDNNIQFNPPEDRLVVGDRVAVIYIEAFSPSQSADKIHAFHVEWLHKAPRDFLSGQITCIYTPLKYRAASTCYVESIKQVIRFEYKGGDSFSAFPGELISMKIKAVPASIGNGYTYIATGINIFTSPLKIN